MKKKLLLVSMVLVFALALMACGQEDEEAAANPMEYISIEDLKESIESESDEYVILDVRKVEDFETSHIVGSYVADQDAAKEGDDESGIANLEQALQEATGSEDGNPEDRYALVCYSGGSYAQKATDLMLEMGISEEQIYTVEGGIGEWEEAGDEYTELLD